MNLLIDTQVVRYDLGGGLRYINGMLPSIVKLNNKFKIYLIGNNGVLELLKIDSKKISLIEPGINTTYPLKRLLYSFKLNQDLDNKFQNNTIYWLPFNYGLPFKMKNITTIVTLHDLGRFQYPEFYPFFRRQFKKRGVAQAVKNANAIICVSKFTKQQLYFYFNKQIRNKPIYTIYEGCSVIDERSFLMHDVLKKRERYMLFVKVGGKNKNIEFLLQCFCRFKDKYTYKGKLYIVGSIEKKRKEQLFKIIRGSGFENAIRFLGFVKDEELPLLYKNCDLFLFPSYYEGFGLPPVEASYYGAKVCASDAAAVEEVSKDFAFLANPFNVDNFTIAMKKALDSKDRKTVDTEKYNWDNAARHFLGICEKIFKNK